jgi:hypothetical protein
MLKMILVLVLSLVSFNVWSKTLLFLKVGNENDIGKFYRMKGATVEFSKENIVENQNGWIKISFSENKYS